MRLIDIYRFVVEKGIEKDPRSKAEIRAALADSRKEFRKLKGVDARCYDKERFVNPYADTSEDAFEFIRMERLKKIIKKRCEDRAQKEDSRKYPDKF